MADFNLTNKLKLRVQQLEVKPLLFNSQFETPTFFLLCDAF